MATKTFIDILNEVALNIYSEPFAGLNEFTQAHIKNTVNTVYKTDICGKHADWLFLNRVVSVPAWITDSKAAHQLNTGTHAPTSKYNLPAVAAGNSVFVAQSKTNANDFPVQINSIIAYLGFQGVNQVDALGYMLICPDNNGSPDIDNPYGTSDAYLLTTKPGINALVNSGSNKTFTFTFPTAVPKNCTYWIVFKITTTTGSASLTISKVTEAITSQTLDAASSTAWTANSFGINFIINTHNASYSSVLTVGPGVKEIFGFYDAYERGNRNNSLEETPSKLDFTPLDTDTYELKRVNANGTWTVNFQSSLAFPLYWLMEHKAMAVDMVADTDEPLLMEDDRPAIVYGSTVELRSEARGLNTPVNIEKMEKRYVIAISNMEKFQRPDEAQVEPDIDAQGYVPSTYNLNGKRLGRVYGRYK